MPAASPVAARRLGRLEHRHQALRERAAGRLERRAHRVPCLRGEHVSLRSPAIACDVARAPHAMRAGPLRRRPARVEERDLAQVLELVGLPQRVERSLRGFARGEQLEPAVAVAPVGERLRRHGAGARARPRDGGPRVERLRLNGDAQLAALRVTGDDRVRHSAI